MYTIMRCYLYKDFVCACRVAASVQAESGQLVLGSAHVYVQESDMVELIFAAVIDVGMV